MAKQCMVLTGKTKELLRKAVDFDIDPDTWEEAVDYVAKKCLRLQRKGKR